MAEKGKRRSKKWEKKSRFQAHAQVINKLGETFGIFV
jgi:hypothetical protein